MGPALSAFTSPREPMGDDPTNGWRRLGIVAALIVAAVTVLINWTDVLQAGDVAPLSVHEEDVDSLGTVHERDVQRTERVLRCLLRADPRQGPPIQQCEGDPLRGQ